MELVVNGGELMLFQGNNTLALATSHKLTINAETVENSSKDNGGGKWKSSVVRKMNWSISSENLYVELAAPAGTQYGFGDLYDLMVAREPVDIVFARTINGIDGEMPNAGWSPDTKGCYSGRAIITSLEANAPNGENATYSVTLEGVGALIHTPVLQNNNNNNNNNNNRI